MAVDDEALSRFHELMPTPLDAPEEERIRWKLQSECFVWGWKEATKTQEKTLAVKSKLLQHFSNIVGELQTTYPEIYEEITGEKLTEGQNATK